MKINFTKSFLITFFLILLSHTSSANNDENNASSIEVIDLFFTTRETLHGDLTGYSFSYSSNQNGQSSNSNTNELVAALKIHVRPPAYNKPPPSLRMVGLDDINSDGLRDLILGINKISSDTRQHSITDMVILMGSADSFYETNEQTIEKIDTSKDIPKAQIEYRKGVDSTPDTVIWNTTDGIHYYEVLDTYEDIYINSSADTVCAIINGVFTQSDHREITSSGSTFCAAVADIVNRPSSGYVKVKKLHSGG